jgi:WD40 repeat protein
MTFLPLTASTASRLSDLAEEACPFVTEINWSQHTQMLAAVHGRGLSVWKGGFGDAPTFQFESPAPLKGCAFSADGLWAAAGGSDQNVILFRCSNMMPEQVIALASPVNSVEFTRDGLHIVAGCADGTVAIVTLDGHIEHVRRLHEAEIARVVSVADDRIATAGWDGAVHVIDSQLEPVTAFETTASNSKAIWMRDMAVAEGGRLAVARADGSVMLLELSGERLALMHTLQTETGGLDAVAWHPSGKLLAAGARDGSIWLWEARSGEPLGQFVRHRKPVLSLTFANNGMFLVSGSGDGRLILWGVEA